MKFNNHTKKYNLTARMKFIKNIKSKENFSQCCSWSDDINDQINKLKPRFWFCIKGKSTC